MSTRSGEESSELVNDLLLVTQAKQLHVLDMSAMDTRRKCNFASRCNMSQCLTKIYSYICIKKARLNILKQETPI